MCLACYCRNENDVVFAMIGDWVQGEPSGCATKCGVGLGLSGTNGTVTCSTSSCDGDAKPAAKLCPKTVDCGA